MSSLIVISGMFNPIALRLAKTLWSFGHSECNRVKVLVNICCHFRLEIHTANVLSCTSMLLSVLIYYGRTLVPQTLMTD